MTFGTFQHSESETLVALNFERLRSVADIIPKHCLMPISNAKSWGGILLIPRDYAKTVFSWCYPKKRFCAYHYAKHFFA